VFTRRQQEVLELIARTGDTGPAAAAELGVTKQTIKNHLAGVFRTLGVHSLIQVYVKLGWLQPPIVRADLELDIRMALLESGWRLVREATPTIDEMEREAARLMVAAARARAARMGPNDAHELA